MSNNRSIGKLLITCIYISIVSCNHNESTKFSLEGKSISLKDGTMIYLECEEFKDSAVVEKGYFKFETVLPCYPILSVLKTKDYNQYRFIWLENKPMIFKASNDDFRTAIISGSIIEELYQNLQRRIDSSSNEQKLTAEIDFMRNNPNSIVSCYILSVYAKEIGKEETLKIFQKFPKENKDSKYGKRISEYIKLSKEPQIGDNYIDFEMLDNFGNPQKFSKNTDKITLLEFWSSWCAPCRKENPKLLKIYKNFKPKGFEIFAVSLDKDRNKWIKAIKEDNLKWMHVSDLKGSENKAALIYGVSGIPDNFLINNEGIIVGRNLRGKKLNEKLHEIFNNKN